MYSGKTHYYAHCWSIRPTWKIKQDLGKGLLITAVLDFRENILVMGWGTNLRETIGSQETSLGSYSNRLGEILITGALEMKLSG